MPKPRQLPPALPPQTTKWRLCFNPFKPGSPKTTPFSMTPNTTSCTSLPIKFLTRPLPFQKPRCCTRLPLKTISTAAVCGACGPGPIFMSRSCVLGCISSLCLVCKHGCQPEKSFRCGPVGFIGTPCCPSSVGAGHYEWSPISSRWGTTMVCRLPTVATRP